MRKRRTGAASPGRGSGTGGAVCVVAQSTGWPGRSAWCAPAGAWAGGGSATCPGCASWTGRTGLQGRRRGLQRARFPWSACRQCGGPWCFGSGQQKQTLVLQLGVALPGTLQHLQYPVLLQQGSRGVSRHERAQLLVRQRGQQRHRETGSVPVLLHRMRQCRLLLEGQGKVQDDRCRSEGARVRA